jgi:hypothetical protein
MTTQDAQLRYDRGTGVFNLDRLDGTLPDAFEAILAFRHFSENGGSGIHPDILFLQLELLFKYELQKIGIYGIENLAVHRDIGTILAQSFAQMALQHHLAA